MAYLSIVKKNLFYIFIYTIIVNLVLGPIQKLADTHDFDHAFKFLKDPVFFALWCSTFLSFLIYSFFSFWVLEKFHRKIAPWKILILLFLVFIFGCFIRYAIQEVCFPAIFGFRNYHENTALLYYFVDNLFFALIYMPIGIIYFFFQHTKKVERERVVLIQQNKKSELSFLKSQMNPHFLFNSLNSIYSLVYQKSDNALSAIDKLSGLMRYSLYESKENVPIEKELDYINNYVEMQRIRLAGNLSVDFQVTGDPSTVKIPPFILIPFIENAFKHGELNNKEQPIEITLDIKNEEISLSVINVISKKQKDSVGGIGLVNVQKRLKLLFHENHKLEITRNNGTFKSYLNLKLS